VRRRPDPADGRYTLAALTSDGWHKVVATAPGHVAEVRRLVFDPLTRAQQRQVREIGRRIMRVIDPNDRCLDDRAPLSRDETSRDETP
jgi:DNA-binding MarR family transcriptional regulator